MNIQFSTLPGYVNGYMWYSRFFASLYLPALARLTIYFDYGDNLSNLEVEDELLGCIRWHDRQSLHIYMCTAALAVSFRDPAALKASAYFVYTSRSILWCLLDSTC